MGVTIQAGGSGVTDSDLYGAITDEMRKEATLSLVRESKNRLFELSLKRETETEEYRETIDEMRGRLGALYYNLSGQLPKDIGRARKRSHSLVGCMWDSWRFLPGKYYDLCGTASWRGESMYLLNAGREGDHWRRWGFSSFKEFNKRLCANGSRLEEMAKEYRNEVIAIRQVGFGVGGMLVGLIGLVLGLVGLRVPAFRAGGQPAPSAIPVQKCREITARTFKVERVVDGETFEIEYDGESTPVRFIGIDAPQRRAPNDPAATAALTKLIGGKTVRIEFAADRKRDNFGRLRCKVYVGSMGVGAEMIRLGHAKDLSYNN